MIVFWSATGVQGVGWLVVQPTIAPKSETRSSFGAQRSQARARTRIFVMTIDEAQANSNTVTGIMIVFGLPARVLFDSRSSISFISTSFALHAN